MKEPFEQIADNTISRINALLDKATQLQKQNPSQALSLAEQAENLASKEHLFYHLALSRKVSGNVHFHGKEFRLAKDCYTSAIHPATECGDPKLLGDIYFNLGKVHILLTDFSQALLFFQESLSHRQKLEEHTDTISSLNQIGLVYWELQNYSESVNYFQKAAVLGETSSNVKQRAATYNNLGNAYVKIEDIPQAMDAYISSLKLKETFGDNADLATANLNLGNLYFSTSDFLIALGYYLEAEKLYLETGDKAKQAIVFSNLGATYNAMKDFDNAALYHNKALQYYKQNDMLESYAKTLSSIGNIHHYKAEYQKAIDTYLEALTIKSSFSNPESLAISYNNLSECYYCLGDYRAALENTRRSMEYSNQIGFKTMLLKNYAQLGKIFAALNDFPNAYEALNSYRILDMEVYLKDKNTVVAKMMVQYDLEGKAKEIEILKSDQHTLEELFSQQVKDKMRYLKLYRSKLNEVKKRLAFQAKLKKLNAELESKIFLAVQDYKAQQQVIVQKSKLESLGKLAAGIAHEINQPLSAISMSIDNLINKTRLNSATPEYLNNKCHHIQEDIDRIRFYTN